MSGIRGGGVALVGTLAALLTLCGAVVVGIMLAPALLYTEPEPEGVCATPSGEGPRIPAQWEDEVTAAAEVAGLPPEVIAAQIAQESGWDPGAVSPAGAVGIAQFMPGTWEQYGEGDPTDPEASIAAQGRYMAALMDLAGEHAEGEAQVELALAAYNWGPGSMEAAGWDWEQGPSETLNYVRGVLRDAQASYSQECAPVSGPYTGDLGDGEWATPLPGGSLTGAGAYGGRNVPGLPLWAQNHVGLDFATEDGKGSVVAPFPFRVTAVYGPDGCVMGKATEGPDFGIALCHLEDWNADVGGEYARGDVVGSEGSRAASVGVGVVEHLHLELYHPDAPDPEFPGPSAPGVMDPTPVLIAKGVMS